MDIIQTGATLALLSLLIYFVMVNVIERTHPSDHAAPTTAVPAKVITNKIPDTIGTPSTGASSVGPGGPGGPGAILAAFDKDAVGVLPSNHDLFEAPAEFGSDITNLGQFYRNNPDVFDKSATYVPDVTSWNQQGDALYSSLVHGNAPTHLLGYNFEDPFYAERGNALSD